MLVTDDAPPSPRYRQVLTDLQATPRAWLVTGAAGFIGSHLVERLLALGQTVVGLDSFAGGSRANIEAATASTPGSRFRLVEGDVRDPAACSAACAGVDFVLHHAGLTVPLHPLTDLQAAHEVNVGGFLNVVRAAHAAGVRRIVFASSRSLPDYPSSGCADDGRSDIAAATLAATERCGETYAALCHARRDVETITLRYPEVFGPRQNPGSVFARTIPRAITALMQGEPCTVGDRLAVGNDLCYVSNIVQANVLAATVASALAGVAYDITCGEEVTPGALLRMLRLGLAGYAPELTREAPRYGAVGGSLPHRGGSSTRARTALGYQPTHGMAAGLSETLAWHLAAEGRRRADPLDAADAPRQRARNRARAPRR